MKEGDGEGGRGTEEDRERERKRKELIRYQSFIKSVRLYWADLSVADSTTSSGHSVSYFGSFCLLLYHFFQFGFACFFKGI